jgi:hypothetical protein
MNNIGPYNPVILTNEGLEIMEAALGMTGRVYRGFDDSQTGRTKGDKMDITVPGQFVAMDAPSQAQDLDPAKVQVELNLWKEIKIKLGDKEMAFTTDRIIREHVRPIVYALVKYFEQELIERTVDLVPWYSDWTATPTVEDITVGVHTGMFNNLVPMDDESKLHFMIDGTVQGKLLANQAFSQFQGAGQDGVNTQTRGRIGLKYGYNFFGSQLAPSRTSATVADLAGAVNNGAGYAAGATSLNVDGFTAGAELKKGDKVIVTGHTQRYTLASDVTLDGGAGTLQIYGSPFVKGGGLESAVVNDQVVTVVLAGGSGSTKQMSLAFHEGLATIAWAKLPDHAGRQNNAVISSIVDPKTGLALRTRVWYDPDNSCMMLAMDALAGIKVLDPNKGWLVRR